MEGTLVSAPRAERPRDAPTEELLARVERLSEEVDRIEDAEARAAAQELVAAILEMHGAGLARIGEVLEEAGEAGEEAKRKLVGDGIVASLLLIHDLHPVPIEDRVQEALAEVRPYMDSHGGDVEVLGVADGVLRLRLKGSCDGCPASASTLELAIKEALERAAPDLLGLEVEGLVDAPAPSGAELPVIQSAWIPLTAPRPGPGEVSGAEVGGMAIVLANVGGSLLAFRDVCAACGEAIAAGRLKGGVLACPHCDRRYYLPRAGRSMDEERLLLEPVPLLETGGEVTVAVPQ